MVVIRNALHPKTVEAVKLAHDAVLEEVQPIIDSLAAADKHDGSFYKGADMHRGLTVKMNATGRFELSSIDTRDGGELVQSSGLAEHASEVMIPPLVREILEAAMVMPWRLSQSGTLPTYPHAEGANALHLDSIAWSVLDSVLPCECTLLAGKGAPQSTVATSH